MKVRQLTLPILAVVLGFWVAGPLGAQNVYLTTVDEYDDDISELDNGAIVEKTSYGYVGYIGFRTDALLYSTAGGTKLWVHSSGLYDVDVLRAPRTKPNTQAALVWISDVRGGGEFLELDSGELLEVDEIDTLTSELWIAPFEAMLLDDGRLLNLSDPSSGLVLIVAIR